MAWLELTVDEAGNKALVNMNLVFRIRPSGNVGSSLLTVLPDKGDTRVFTVMETMDDIGDMLTRVGDKVAWLQGGSWR